MQRRTGSTINWGGSETPGLASGLPAPGHWATGAGWHGLLVPIVSQTMHQRDVLPKLLLLGREEILFFFLKLHLKFSPC